MVVKIDPRIRRWVTRHWVGLGLGSAGVLAVAFVLVFIIGYDQAMAARGRLSDKTLSLVGGNSAAYAKKLVFNESKQQYDYNAGYQPSDSMIGQSSGPKFTATIPVDPTKNVTVTDPATSSVLGFAPEFELGKANKQSNHLVYPLMNKDASKVFTLGAANLKEDIILHKFQGETASFSYHLALPDNTEARIDADGTVGIFGVNRALLGSVTTGSDADAQLLAKAREKSAKTSLIFSIPAPFVKDVRGLNTSVQAKWILDGTHLTLSVKNLSQAVYPLTLDPSVFVTSAAQFMAGNNESNVDFDTSNELIQKGQLTGARINAWTPVAGTQDLPANLWNHATVMAGGYVYVIGGSTGSTNQATVYWAKLDPTTYTITSPTPGSAAGSLCTQWCTDAAYNLPGVGTAAPRAGLSAVAYNGYLYAIGGFDGTGARTSTVSYAKLGANGEPISWTATTAISGTGPERSYAAAIAYQNKLYVLGGQNNANTGGFTAATSSQFASINPDGTIGTWANTTTTMPASLWGHTALQYNGYIYLVGGVSGTTTQTAVYYNKVSATGDLTNSWTTTSAFGTARGSFGGSIASIWGGYMYVSGGCATMTATNCTQFASGTASQSGTTITGTGFTASEVGMVMVFANGITATITSFTSATSIEAANDAQTVASQTYVLDLNEQSLQMASINADGTLSAWRTINLDAGQYYMTGTASEATTNNAITGVGTNWTIDMIGERITWANGTTDIILGWLDATHLIATTSRTVSAQGYTITKGVYYAVGTAAQATTTITGTGTTFTSDMVGMTITFANGTTEIISGFTDTTHLTVAAGFSQTVASSVFVIRPTHDRLFSTGFVAWRSTLYNIGGCAAMSGGNCTSVTAENEYGHINSDGDVSQARDEPTMPTAGTSNTAGTVGRWSNGVVINNGFIYTVGGCGASPCTGSGNANANLAYAAIGSDGTITTNGVASCNGGGAATWCVVQVALNGTVGLAAFGITVYNNTIVLAGGQSITASYQTHFWFLRLNANGSPNGTFVDNGATAGNVLLNAVGYPFLFTRAANATTGNIYAIGGCTGAAGSVGCTAYPTANSVLKCTLSNANLASGTAGAISGCTVTGQKQLSIGVAISANANYGKFVYLCGGADSNGNAQTSTCYRAYIDETNNIVRPDGAATAGWQTTTAVLPEIRRRATGFAANGYMYVLGGHDGDPGANGTTLHDVVFAKIEASTGDLIGTKNSALFDTSTTTISGRWNLGSAVANGYFYAVGGCTSGFPPTSCTSGTGGMSGVVESVQVHNNYSGSPKQYSTAAQNTGADNIGGRSVVNNGYIYMAGGCTSLTCTVGTDSAVVSYAQISANGDLGTWAATTSMGTKRAYFGLTAYNGYMYAIGGSNQATTALATTEHAFICDGTATGGCTAGGGNIGKVGTWSADTSMGAGNERADFGFSLFNGYVYLAGGTNNSGTLQTTVFHALLGTGSIGAWTTNDTAFTTARSGAVLVAYGATLYLLGGFDGTNYLLDTQFVNIIANAADGTIGTIGAWDPGTSLPQAIRQGAGFAANGYLYVFGGRSAATTCTTNTYMAPISGYLTVDSPNYPTTGFDAATNRVTRYGIGGWSQTVVSYPDARFGGAAAYGSGRAYLLGGGCSALVGTGTGTTANRIVFSTLQAQPQVANYSLAIDADTDVFPAKWLLNGIDNGTGAQWNLNYQSSNNATHAWGTNTNAGAVTLGTPGTYTYFDAATGERYYFMRVSVDASQAFGFPEDVTRGPTVTDLTLEFSADPGKRLHHGKTFTGGLLQPLDAPF